MQEVVYMENTKRRKTREGVVVSDKMDKTVVVRVERLTKHSLYNKTVKRAKKFKAHDEHNMCSIGDVVEIVETRPLSKEKRWRVTKILRKQQEKTKDNEQLNNEQ
jgi:small subunit ribosomal protein S17